MLPNRKPLVKPVVVFPLSNGFTYSAETLLPRIRVPPPTALKPIKYKPDAGTVTGEPRLNVEVFAATNVPVAE